MKGFLNTGDGRKYTVHKDVVSTRKTAKKEKSALRGRAVKNALTGRSQKSARAETTRKAATS